MLSVEQKNSIVLKPTNGWLKHRTDLEMAVQFEDLSKNQETRLQSKLVLLVIVAIQESHRQRGVKILPACSLAGRESVRGGVIVSFDTNTAI